MSQHALLSPSGAECWMNCAGSAAMQKGLPDNPNEYSDEGTAAHLLGSTCLEEGKNADAYLGFTIFVGATEDFDGALWVVDPAHVGFVTRRTYVVDDEMTEQVQKYVDQVHGYAATGGTLHVEQRISISAFTGEEGAEGTSDAVVTRPGELTVVDLKYGMGVRVNAERNKQLMIYALGVREEMDLVYGPFERIRFVISQPRLDHLSEWDCTAAELDAFGEEVKVAAAKALYIYINDSAALLAHDHTDLHPSEDACRWCKAKSAIRDGKPVTCPALDKFVMDAAACDFEAINPTTPHDHADFKAKFRKIGLIEDWCKSMRATGEAMLFEAKNSPEIIDALGIYLVGGKKGNRQWADEEKVDALLRKMRLNTEERCNLKLKSPTQIEKILKATPKRLKRLREADLITQKDGQPSVAIVGDERPPWVPPDTADDFSPVEEESIT